MGNVFAPEEGQTTIKQAIQKAMNKHAEQWADVVSFWIGRFADEVDHEWDHYDENGDRRIIELSKPEQYAALDHVFNVPTSYPTYVFTLWTKHRVYFPAVYDAGLWVDSVPRNPCQEATRHIGGC